MPCKIYYFSLTDEQTKTEKLEWFKNTKLQDIDFQLIKPDKNANWINLADENNGFDDLIPVCSKDAKLGKGGNAIFELFANGAITARDEWVYDLDKVNLEKKITFLIENYNQEQLRWQQAQFEGLPRNFIKRNIKWSDELIDHLVKGTKLSFESSKIQKNLYRPYFKTLIYSSKVIIHRFGQMNNIFPNENSDNICIAFSFNSTDFASLATNVLFDFALLKFGNGNTQCLPLYRYSNGERVENITDWALSVFSKQYSVSSEQLSVNSEQKEITDNCLLITEKLITKKDIFHYVYAVLHKPEYRTTYEQNLKREFPRIPLYDDFWKYAEAGKKLMELHLNYETAPLPPTGGAKSTIENSGVKTPPVGGGGLLVRKDIDLEGFKAGKAGKKKKTSDADKEVAEVATAFTVYPILKIKDGNIEIDELTTLCGVPAQALAYKLGNRSAIEWILDQYKPYKSDDKTIQEQFNNYNFADYKEQVIELLQKVCWLSVETMKIVGEL